MEQQIKFQNVKNKVIKIFWVFIIGSILGCILETIVGTVSSRSFQLRKGLIYGPFIPVYGIGLVIYYLIISNIKDIKKVFLLSMILGAGVEFACSYFQELCFGTVSWDYSDMPFNIAGRTSLLFAIYWGIAGVVFVKFILPLLLKLDICISNKKFRYITVIVATFMIFNICISWAAGVRQNERVQKIEPNSKLDAFLDKHYPDYVMDKVYSNKITRVKK